jgi:hypothetical protein
LATARRRAKPAKNLASGDQVCIQGLLNR